MHGCACRQCLPALQETELQCKDTSWVQTHWDPFLKQVRAAGWETDRLCLGESTWRVSWGSSLHHE